MNAAEDELARACSNEERMHSGKRTRAYSISAKPGTDVVGIAKGFVSALQCRRVQVLVLANNALVTLEQFVDEIGWIGRQKAASSPQNSAKSQRATDITSVAAATAGKEEATEMIRPPRTSR